MALLVGRRLVTGVGEVASRGGGWSCVCQKSTYTALPNDYNCKVELALTSDGRTIVCYHPSVDIPYEHTKLDSSLAMKGRRLAKQLAITSCKNPELRKHQKKPKDLIPGKGSIKIGYTLPIPRPSPVENKEETHEQVLKARLEKEGLQNKQRPTIEELSKMFYTTKHRWYPFGQYHRRRINPNPPKDR